LSGSAHSKLVFPGLFIIQKTVSANNAWTVAFFPTLGLFTVLMVFLMPGSVFTVLNKSLGATKLPVFELYSVFRGIFGFSPLLVTLATCQTFIL
jgi:hypothetical protein